MPEAKAPALHHDRLLASIAIRAWAREDDQLIGARLFPEVRVGKQSDRYAIIEPDGFFRIPTTLRAPGTVAEFVEFSVSSDAYFADNHALAARTPLEELQNADDAFMLRENKTEMVTGLIKLAQEQRIANIVTSGTNNGSYYVPGSNQHWTDVNTANILAQVNTGTAFIRSQTGLVPNTMVLDWGTYMAARQNKYLLDMYRYTSGGQLSRQQLADTFGIPNLLVAEAIHNSAKEGQTKSMSDIWGGSDGICWLGHVRPQAGLRTVTYGLRMAWRNPIYPDQFGVSRQVKNGAGDEHAEFIEVGHYQDEKPVAKSLGYLIDGTRA